LRSRGKSLSLIGNKGRMNLKRLKMSNARNAFKDRVPLMLEIIA